MISRRTEKQTVKKYSAFREKVPQDLEDLASSNRSENVGHLLLGLDNFHPSPFSANLLASCFLLPFSSCIFKLQPASSQPAAYVK